MKTTKQLCMIWVSTISLLLLLFFISLNLGSLKVTPLELIKGLFIEYNPTVSTIYDIRFPRIFVAMVGGGSIAVSGVLFQAVMKNPLADPSMIGVSSGASLFAFIFAMLFPNLANFSPLFAFVGGMGAFILVYTLSWKRGTNPLRILLVGIAISSVFSGIIEALETLTAGNISIVNSNLTLKTWSDVRTIVIYCAIAFFLALCFSDKCNLLMLEDKICRAHV